MANITVAELLFDADFVDPCVVRREIETVGDDGIAVHEEQRISILASIQAQSGDNLFMSPDLARTEGTYEVITTFPLLCATDTTAADIVEWDGQVFVVTSIGRFGNFAAGQGHYEGIMTLKSIPRQWP